MPTVKSSHEISPLRYPGGKGSLQPFFARLLSDQPERCKVFIEPFAGGAGVALRLLVDGHADRIVINDLEPGIAALWRAVFTRPEDVARWVETVDLSIATWREQHRIACVPGEAKDDFQLGLATFYMNRTNRSGILDARPIGGLAQAGPWKLDARFNRAPLAARIRRLGAMGDRVTVTQRDGVEMVADYLTPSCFIYADPPYLTKADDLYLNDMTWENHQALARTLIGSQGKWMVSYDHDKRVRLLYPDQRLARFGIAHTAARPHVGQEYAIFADGLVVKDLERLGHEATFVSSADANDSATSWALDSSSPKCSSRRSLRATAECIGCGPADPGTLPTRRDLQTPPNRAEPGGSPPAVAR
jgi:DNA adenine methylase